VVWKTLGNMVNRITFRITKKCLAGDKQCQIRTNQDFIKQLMLFTIIDVAVSTDIVGVIFFEHKITL
jgi:hypothetical protein